MAAQYNYCCYQMIKHKDLRNNPCTPRNSSNNVVKTNIIVNITDQETPTNLHDLLGSRF